MNELMACSPITSLSDFAALIRPHSEDKIGYYYRGEPKIKGNNTPRQLLPALLRKTTLDLLKEVHETNDPVTIQGRMLGRLQRYVPWSLWPESNNSGTELSFGDRLCLAQHHGLPTLLLDWTRSPLAALYFSVTKHKNLDGRVWLMKLQPHDLRGHCTCHLEEGHNFKEDFEVPQLIVPKPFSRRIEVQVGRFIYFGKCRTPLEDFTDYKGLPFQDINCVTIEAKNKDKIIQELAHYQVHGGTLFPGLDGYARYLGEGGL